MRDFKITTVEYKFLKTSFFRASRKPELEVDHCNQSDFSNNFHLPWRFEKLGIHQGFVMIIVSLEVRIVNVFLFTEI